MKIKRITIIIILLLLFLAAGMVVAAGEAQVQPAREWAYDPTTTPVYVQLDPGGRLVFLCGDSGDDHYAVQPVNRHGAYVDCIDGDIEP